MFSWVARMRTFHYVAGSHIIRGEQEWNSYSHSLPLPSVNSHSHFYKVLLPFHAFKSKYGFPFRPVPFPKKQTECDFYLWLSYTKYRIALRNFTLHEMSLQTAMQKQQGVHSAGGQAGTALLHCRADNGSHLMTHDPCMTHDSRLLLTCSH